MPPAARITDSHACPIHGGGPIVPPGEPTVLIGYLPAARVTDLAVCPPVVDMIRQGESSVLIGNLPAARIGDPMVHGGVIVQGCPTVLIGSTAQTFALQTDKPFCEECEKTKQKAAEGQPEPEVQPGPEAEVVEAPPEQDLTSLEQEIQRRIAELMNQGHGPQRHEGQITIQQLKDRVQSKLDPETGTRIDQYTGNNHKCGDHATKINSEASYVQAENFLRNHEDFITGANQNKPVIAVKCDLKDVFGDNYQEHVTGFSRTTLWPDTTTPPIETDFTEGTIKAIYRKNSVGGYDLVTMFPEPKQ